MGGEIFHLVGQLTRDRVGLDWLDGHHWSFGLLKAPSVLIMGIKSWKRCASDFQ